MFGLRLKAGLGRCYREGHAFTELCHSWESGDLTSVACLYLGAFVEGFVLLVIGKIRFLRCGDVSQLSDGCSIISALTVAGVLGDGDGCKDAEYRQNDRQFNNGKTW